MSESDVKRATTGSSAFGAGANRRESLSSDDKVKAVMREFEKGTLHSGDGKIVTDRDQALAIAYGEAGKSNKSIQKSIEEIQKLRKSLK